MPHFLFSSAWSAYGWAAQLIATIFVNYVKSSILSSSVGGIKQQNTLLGIILTPVNEAIRQMKSLLW